MRILISFLVTILAFQSANAKESFEGDWELLSPDTAYEILIENAYDPQKISNAGDTLLHNAAKKQDFSAVKLGVLLGLDPTIPNKAGDTPLHIAAQKGYLPIVEYLIDLGAPFDWPNNLEQTPYHKALGAGHSEISQYLLDLGFIPSDELTDHLIAQGYAPSKNHATVAHSAATNGDLQTLVSLIDSGELKPRILNNRGHTALISAIVSGQSAVVAALLDSGIFHDSIDTYSKNGLTALHYAVIRGDVHATKRLLEAGANSNTLTESEWKEDPEHRREMTEDDWRSVGDENGFSPNDSYWDNYEYRNKGWVYPVYSSLSLALSYQPHNNPLINLLKAYGAEKHVEPSSWGKDLRTS